MLFVALCDMCSAAASFTTFLLFECICWWHTDSHTHQEHFENPLWKIDSRCYFPSTRKLKNIVASAAFFLSLTPSTHRRSYFVASCKKKTLFPSSACCLEEWRARAGHTVHYRSLYTVYLYTLTTTDKPPEDVLTVKLFSSEPELCVWPMLPATLRCICVVCIEIQFINIFMIVNNMCSKAASTYCRRMAHKEVWKVSAEQGKVKKKYCNG